MNDRLRQITACMDLLGEIRRHPNRTTSDMVGEMDTLTELHELLYDEHHAASNRAVSA
jgi:hypothetical protein